MADLCRRVEFRRLPVRRVVLSKANPRGQPAKRRSPVHPRFQMIGVYGGTFDPIHYGHLRTALEVKEAVSLDELRFIPSREPPHRDAPEASPEQRLEMLRAALQDAEPGFCIDTRELERPGPSYMVDTLASIRQEIRAAPLCLIVGLDAFAGLDRWHRWRELLDLAHLLVMQRPGYSPELPDPLQAMLPERVVNTADALRESPAGRIHFITLTLLDISATRIRSAVAQGLSPRYLTPDPVLHLIHSLNLYRCG